MNKENILEMSRQENKNKDLVARDAELKASRIAGISMSVLALVFYLAQIVLQDNCNWGLFAIITLCNAVMNIVRGIKLSKKGVIILGVVWLLVTIALSVAHIGALIEASTIL